MRIEPGHPEYDKYIVYLNGWIQKGAVAADDTEGWADVIDIKAMAELDIATPGEVWEADPEFTDIKTKRLHGIVRLVRVE